jgi:hypothetical protein
MQCLDTTLLNQLTVTVLIIGDFKKKASALFMIYIVLKKKTSGVQSYAFLMKMIRMISSSN